MRTPFVAATPVPTMTAVGVARPSAHGHAMTITAMPNISAKRNKECPSGIQVCGKMLNEPHTHQAMVVKRESETTTGTKTADILSATA